MQSSRILRRGAPVALASILLSTFGCAARTSPEADAPAPKPSPDAAPEATSADLEEEAPGLLELCRFEEVEPGENNRLDETQRVLQETFCGAVLWLDGIFGGEGDVESARRTSGWVELSALYSDFHGLDPDGRLSLSYQLPTLSRRLNLFLGRGDREEFIEGREEGLAVRSSTLARQGEAEWLTGLGYAPPGRLGRAFDVRLGVRVQMSPDMFAQLRFRRVFFESDVSLWRFRETFFWEDGQGFGATTTLGYHRALTPTILFHWNNRGTFSQATTGLDWRSTAVFYHGMGERRAIAGEGFVRGATSAEVPLQEFGVRAIYRQPVFRPYLLGEYVVGYSWPRLELDEVRAGAPMIGIGAELHFGDGAF